MENCGITKTTNMYVRCEVLLYFDGRTGASTIYIPFKLVGSTAKGELNNLLKFFSLLKF